MKVCWLVYFCDNLYFLHDAEFWKKIPSNEPYRVVLGYARDRLYQTRERSRHLLAHGYSDIPEEATFTNVEEVHPLFLLSCTFPLIIFILLLAMVFWQHVISLTC